MADNYQPFFLSDTNKNQTLKLSFKKSESFKWLIHNTYF